MILDIHQFHTGIRACVRLDSRVYSEGFAAEQGLRHMCMLVPLLFNILFLAVVNVVYTRFKADEHIMDALVHLRQNAGVGGRGKATTGESALVTSLWGLRNADNAGVVS